MIKVDFWDDEKLASTSRDARLTYIALWNFSDDYGVVKGHHAWLKNNIYPYDEKLGLDTFKKWLLELETLKRIIPFSTNGEFYYFIPKFATHQTINRPSVQRNPEPPENIYELSNNKNECSWSTHGALIDEIKLNEVKLKERKEAFSLPSKEEINESSKIKLKQDIEELSQKLYEEKIFPKVHAFKNKMLKDGKNERTILHVLARCYLKRTFDEDAWAYCMEIMKIEDGNYNERDYLKTVS